MPCDENATCCDISSDVNNAGLYTADLESSTDQNTNITVLATDIENLFSFMIGLVHLLCCSQESKLRILNSLSVSYNALLSSINGNPVSNNMLLYMISSFVTGFFQTFYAFGCSCSKCSRIPFSSATLTTWFVALYKIYLFPPGSDPYTIFESDPNFVILAENNLIPSSGISINNLSTIPFGFQFPPDDICTKYLVTTYANFLASNAANIQTFYLSTTV
jgi:hypothetical protein